MERFLRIGADLNHHNSAAQETPLHFAIAKNDVATAQWLIEKGIILQFLSFLSFFLCLYFPTLLRM
jgi:hypothetical protein